MDSLSAVCSFPDYSISINSLGHVLFNNRIERPGLPTLTITGTPFNGSCRLGLVDVPDSSVPDGTRSVDVVIGSSGMWVENPDSLHLVAATSNSHATLPDAGRITDNGTALTSSGIWLNGGTFSLDDWVPSSGWYGIQPFAMATNGLIAATAKSNATGDREIVLLEPIAVKAMTTVLARYITSTSALPTRSVT